MGYIFGFGELGDERVLPLLTQKQYVLQNHETWWILEPMCAKQFGKVSNVINLSMSSQKRHLNVFKVYRE